MPKGPQGQKRPDAVVAETEGVVLNQLINVATESYFAERAARADIPEALRILSRAGKGNPPVKGDELPD